MLRRVIRYRSCITTRDGVKANITATYLYPENSSTKLIESFVINRVAHNFKNIDSYDLLAAQDDVFHPRLNASVWENFQVDKDDLKSNIIQKAVQEVDPFGAKALIMGGLLISVPIKLSLRCATIFLDRTRLNPQMIHNWQSRMIAVIWGSLFLIPLGLYYFIDSKEVKKIEKKWCNEAIGLASTLSFGLVGLSIWLVCTNIHKMARKYWA